MMPGHPNPEQRPDREPSSARSASECMGGLKYPEAWFRVRGRCESEQHKSGPTSRAAGTARGPGPVSGCARWVFLLLLVLSLGQLHAETIALHLTHGDRMAGTIISEDTNRVLLTNSWIKELAVPAAQIERREVLPAEAAAAKT